MPVCPNCNYEYVAGITICPDCNSPLIDDEDLLNYRELTEEYWVLVYTSSNEFEIDVIKGFLESDDIEVSILSQKDSSFPTPGNLSVIKLMVRKEDVQTALEFIEVFKKNESVTGEDEA